MVKEYPYFLRGTYHNEFESLALGHLFQLFAEYAFYVTL